MRQVEYNQELDNNIEKGKVLIKNPNNRKRLML